MPINLFLTLSLPASPLAVSRILLRRGGSPVVEHHLCKQGQRSRNITHVNVMCQEFNSYQVPAMTQRTLYISSHNRKKRKSLTFSGRADGFHLKCSEVEMKNRIQFCKSDTSEAFY